MTAAPTSPIPADQLQSWRYAASTRRPPKFIKGLDAVWEAGAAHVVALAPRRRRLLAAADRAVAMRDTHLAMTDAQLQSAMAVVRALALRGRMTGPELERGVAIVREAARRSLGLEPYREQLAAGLAMHAGCIAEVATGEGKTLAAGVLATLIGWRGRGCHVITVNDYLAQRDAEAMASLYAFAGLRVAFITEEMPPDARRDAYAADVTYATNKSVTADYLRDQLLGAGRQTLTGTLLSEMLGGPERHQRSVLRGLDAAIIDEADSILIDEAVTPLIISGATPNDEQTAAFEEAAVIARRFEPGRDYHVDHGYREVRLTERGRQRLAEQCSGRGGIWSGRRRSEELVTQALTAGELFHRDQHYVVQEGKVVIVDESTGRLMPDRTWREGLHQAVEAKESLEVQPPKGTLARVSFQRFFRMYRKLCGMTGTAAEASNELWRTYRTPVVRIPTHRPCQREEHPDRVFGSDTAKWLAVCERVRAAHATGRPVLVGTRSVDASETLSGLLTDAGVPHRVLNAVRHKEEAEIVKLGGQKGAVTVATNMAGRGTDIKLGRGVEQLGGLLVIAAERNDVRRIDRQLFGRSGRQGDPGEAHTLISLDDELLRRYGGWPARILRPVINHGESGPIGRHVVRPLLWFAQQRAQRRAVGMRRHAMRQDHHLDEQLGFAGSP